MVEKRFALSTLTLGGWLWRYAKRNGLATALGAALVLGLFWLIWTTHGWWWLAAAAAFFAVSIVFGQLLPVLILPLFYKIEKLDAPELAERIGRLAAGTGLSIEGVYRMALSDETVKANAMLAGLGAPAACCWATRCLRVSAPTRSKSSSPTRSATTSFGTSAR